MSDARTSEFRIHLRWFLQSSASIVVNTTSDGDNVNVNAGCDADAVTPGEQCTLRAAIQHPPPYSPLT